METENRPTRENLLAEQERLMERQRELTQPQPLINGQPPREQGQEELEEYGRNAGRLEEIAAEIERL